MTDSGRLLFVPLSLALMALNGVKLMSTATQGGTGSFLSLAVVASAALTTVFYAAVLRAYLARPAARATSRNLGVNTAAILATWLPFTLPLVHPPSLRVGVVAAGDFLMLAGLSWSVWALRSLGQALSIIPQARTVVSRGPYRLVRHPLYLGEITSTAGIVLVRLSPLTAIAWLVLVCLQVYRAGHEERVLSGALPDYSAYAAGTRRLVPGLY